MRRSLLMAFWLILMGLELQAETIFISLLETTPDKALHNFEASSAWESGVLDALFDLGVIVSNTPVQGSATFNRDEARQIAREGGADLLLIVDVTYPIIPEEKSKIRAVPSTVRFSLIAVDSGRLIKELQYIPTKQSETLDEDKETAKKQTQLLYKK